MKNSKITQLEIKHAAFSSRMKDALSASSFSVADLARKSGITYEMIRRYVEGYAMPRPDKLLRLANALNVPASWLQFGGNFSFKSGLEPQSNATFFGHMETWDKNTPLYEDEIEVPFYKEFYPTSEKNFADNMHNYNGSMLRFSKSSLSKCGINASEVVCITADGDSMSPVIPDGATLGINKADKNIRDGKIYAINHGGLLRTKILKKRPDNRLLLQSYNQEEYPDEEVSLEEITVIGRIFWWSVMNQ